MRLILRSLGTWLIGLALVLLVIDGTKSLGANRLMLQSLAQLWSQLHEASMLAVQSAAANSPAFAPVLEAMMAAGLALPVFAVFGVPGIVLALLGRKPRRERFLRQEI